MEDDILDLSEEDILVRETQKQDSPDTFSKGLIDRLGICWSNQGSEATNLIEQNKTNYSRVTAV